MFAKKQIIFRGGRGVCKVDDIIKLNNQKNDVFLYYALCSVNDESKRAFLPVEGHTDELRELIPVEEAKAKKESGYEDLSQAEKEEIEYVLQSNAAEVWKHTV